MRRRWSMMFCAGLVVAGALPGAAEIVVLRDGQTIQASVLRETPERVLIDLGYDVLAIPRQYVREVRVEEVAAAAVSDVRATDHLYSTADLPLQSVKQLVDRFGEGVVLVSTANGLGSGFFVSAQGHLITNAHVIEDERRIAVTVFRKVGDEFRRQKIEDVDIVATNAFMDLALLRAELPEGYEPVVTYLDDDDDLRDGDAVFAVGNPLGLERSVSEGIVSRRNRASEGLVYIQTTAQINPGNSGGPLFNMRGEVVGVTNMKIWLTEGLAFAIPTRYVIDFLRNREAYAYNSESSEAGYRYVQPAERLDPDAPAFLQPEASE